jgi:hypothetical protein
MAEQLNLSINVSGNVEESLGSIKKQLREAQNEVTALSDKFGATSKEAVNAAKRAGELRDRIGDARALTEAFNPDAKFKALSASLSGVAGGFAAVQGAIGLFGGESKELEKQLLKVQSAMALSQGLQSVGESIDSFKNLGTVIKNSTVFLKANEIATKGAALATRLFGGAVDTTAVSFKVLKGVIAATGIGLLVVAIGFLVEKLMTMGKSSKEAADRQKELNKELANTTKEVVKQSEKFIESDTKLKIARAKLAGASEKELLEIEKQGIKAKVEVRQRNYEDLLKTDKIAASDLAQQNADAQDEIILADLAFQQKQKELREEANKKKKEEQEAEDKRILEGKEKARKAGFDFDMLVLDKQEKEKEEKEKKDKEDEEAGNAEVEKLFEQEEKIQGVIIESNNKKLLKQKEYNQLVLQAEQEVQDAKFGVASAGLNLLGSLVGQNEKIGNAIFVADKALAVAKIITNTIGEISGYALANSPLGLPGAALTAKMALGAKLRAASGIATIAATTISKFKGGSTSSNFGSGGAISTSGVPIIPQQNQTQTTNISQQSINDLGNQAIKAYVVETDVTSSQQRIAAIQQRARFN